MITILLLLSLQEDAALRDAVKRSIPVLQKSIAEYPDQRSCFSCHHQTFPIIALATAKKRGFAIDDKVFADAIEFTAKSLGKGNPLLKAELSLYEGKKDKAFIESVTRQFIRPKTNTQVIAGKAPVTLSEISGSNTCIQGSDRPTDYVVLAALVEAPEGSFTFKFEGPASVVNEWREAFVALLKSAEK